jgi:hypothetical protein
MCHLHTNNLLKIKNLYRAGYAAKVSIGGQGGLLDALKTGQTR